MESIFLNILKMSVTAGCIIIAVILIRLLLKKAPRKYSYLLWSVVGFRLLCPVAFSSRVSIFNLKLFRRPEITGGAKAAELMSQAVGAVDTGSASGTISAITDMVDTDTISAVTGMMETETIQVGSDMLTSVGNSMSQAASGSGNHMWLTMLTLIWLAVMEIMLVYSIISYVIMSRRLRDAMWDEGVYRSDSIVSPFVFGLIKPRIYIPDYLDNNAAEYVLLHEQYHIIRRDYLVKAFAFLLLCIHWFNPLVWAAFYMMGRDMEMSCDEAVLDRMAAEQKLLKNGMTKPEVVKGYAYALVDCASRGNFNAWFQIGFCEMPVKNRIKNVLNYKKCGRFINIFILAACILVLAACSTNSPKDNTGSGQNDVNNNFAQNYLDVEYTFNVDDTAPMDVIVEYDGSEDCSIISWDGLTSRMEGNVITSGIYAVSDGIDLDGDGEDERILQCMQQAGDANVYNTIVLDKYNGTLLCLERPDDVSGTGKAYAGFILDLKFSFEDRTRRYDCSEDGDNGFLKVLRDSLMGIVWNEQGELLAPDSQDGMSTEIIVGITENIHSSFVIPETGGSILVTYEARMWLQNEPNKSFFALLTYELRDGELIFVPKHSVIMDCLASGEVYDMQKNFEYIQ